MRETNVKILTSGNDADFDKLCKDAAENIEQPQKTEEFKEIISKPFSKEIIDHYRGSPLIQISDDGTAFSFSFGIPMPK